MNTKKNLILGAVRGYRFNQLKPFVESLRRTTFNGDLILVSNELDAETCTELSACGVKLIPFQYRGSGALNSWSRFWPWMAPFLRLVGGSDVARSLMKQLLPLQTMRFFVYRDFLRSHSNLYENVLITDVRDVIFQKDPFEDFDGRLTVFEENPLLRLDHELQSNAPWIEALYGLEGLRKIGHFPILCSGTTMGSVPSLLAYLKAFEGLTVQAKDISLGGSDQGIHNFLCRHLPPEGLKIARNGEGPIFTMGSYMIQDREFRVNPDGNVTTMSGNLIPVLHQYDRFPELAETLLGSFADVA